VFVGVSHGLVNVCTLLNHERAWTLTLSRTRVKYFTQFIREKDFSLFFSVRERVKVRISSQTPNKEKIEVALKSGLYIIYSAVTRLPELKISIKHGEPGITSCRKSCRLLRYARSRVAAKQLCVSICDVSQYTGSRRTPRCTHASPFLVAPRPPDGLLGPHTDRPSRRRQQSPRLRERVQLQDTLIEVRELGSLTIC
jgi:hypothetical protein